MRVIGTAGHVDHGKSSLVAALTGIHPDRLKEEQERQMTIDLGFAWLTLPDGEEVGIVDVPGHRDFIENMLAGVGGIDAALLVIAADEGIMPQTREHLAILDLLQIPTGLVVLNKIDLVDDPDWLDLIETDIRQALKGTILQDAPICRVSALSGAGLPELTAALGLLLQERPPRPDLGRARLPIDRVFSLPGFGTVVTGTLSDGRLSVGDEVEILPAGLRGRVRGLQTHKKKEDVAVPGSRTAVNLAGVETAQIRRGDVLAHPGQYQPTRRLDVQFRLLADAAAPLRHNAEVKFFVGAAESTARLRLLGTESLEPGQTGWLQLELRRPVVAARGDRYILRRPSPPETLGGGQVVDPQPARRHKRFDRAVLEALEKAAGGSPAEVLLQTALTVGLVSRQEILQRVRLEPAAAEAALDELLASGQMLLLGDLLVAALYWSALRQKTLTTLDAYLQANPLRRGMPPQELRSRLKVPPRPFAALIQKLAGDGELIEDEGRLTLPGRVVTFTSAQQAAVERLMARFSAAPFAPPSVKECQAEVGEEVFAALLEQGDLINVSAEVVFRKADYEIMVAKVCQAIEARGRVTLAEVRDLLGTSRRYVQALLEHLDAVGVTVRAGDYRQLKR